MPADALRTERLFLRRWRESDREPFAAMNADARVTEHLPGPMTRHASDALVDRIEAHFAVRGFGVFALEIAETGEFIGFTGLSVPQWEAHFTPCVEIGWRLAFAHWGRGYATEAARASLAYGFTGLEFDEIVSFTVPANTASRAVMERIGMTHDPREDFDHPALPEGHPLRRHVLYRIGRAAWRR